MATCSSVLAWKMFQQRRLVGYSPWDCKGIGHDWLQTPIHNRNDLGREKHSESCYWANFILLTLTIIGRNKYILAPKFFDSTQHTHTHIHTHTHTSLSTCTSPTLLLSWICPEIFPLTIGGAHLSDFNFFLPGGRDLSWQTIWNCWGNINKIWMCVLQQWREYLRSWNAFVGD